MRNLRVFLETLTEQGNSVAYKEEVDWSLEAASLSAVSAQKHGPALHFQKVKGFPDASLVSGLYRGPGTLFPQDRTFWQNTAIGLGFDRDIRWVEFLGKLMERYMHSILPVEVEAGPVKDQKMAADDVDITKFPIPFIHKGDGGRYLNLATLIVKDPETGGETWTAPRFMVVDGKRLLCPLPADTIDGRIFAKYKALNKPMPFCIVIGPPPAVTFCSYIPMEKGESYAAIAGGLNLDPIELNRAETNDMMVPSQAEIVLEGKAYPQGFLEEGPYPDFWFYTEKAPAPVFEIETVTSRPNPIIPFSVDGAKPYDDHHNMMAIGMAYELYRRCQMVRNYPINWIQFPLEFNLNVAIVQGPIIFHGYVSWLAKYIFSQTRHFRALYNKIVVVDHMIPEIALEEVMVEISLKTHAASRFRFIDEVPIGPNVRCLSEEEKKRGTQSGIYIDTTWPKEWTGEDIPRRVGIEGSYPQGLLDKVVENYTRLGLKGKPIIYPESIKPF